MDEELSDKIKKNLLDLQYNKYSQYFNTSIIILFTYVIGVVIGFLTRQIDYNKVGQMILLVTISSVVITIIVLIMLKCKNHQKNIINEVKKLKI